MRKLLFFVAVKLCIISYSFGQLMPQPKMPLPGSFKIPMPKVSEKWFFEGSMGMSFGDSTKVSISPVIGYHFNKHLSFGIGPDIQYTQNSKTGSSINNIGGRLFLRYTPQPVFPYLQLEYEGIKGPVDSLENSSTKWYSTVYLGAGYNLPLSKSSAFNITILRNLSWKGHTPIHDSPWNVRMGITSLINPDGKTEKDPDKTFKASPTNNQKSNGFFVEGNFSFTKGDTTQLEVSPLIGYYFSNKFSTGIGFNYRYIKQKTANKISTDYGGRLFARYSLSSKKPFYLQTEYEVLTDKLENENNSKLVSSWLVGAGYANRLGGKYMSITVLRNMSWEEGESIQSSPWVIKIGMGGKLPSFKSTGTKKSKSKKPADKKKTDKEKEIKKDPSKKNDFWNKFYLEGNFGLSFGDSSSIAITPLIGYKFSDHFSAGIGITYEKKGISDESNNYGGSLFLRYQPKEKWPYLHTEYQSINTYNQEVKDRNWKSNIMIGAGHSLRLSKYGTFTISVLRKLNVPDKVGEESSPWVIRTGVSTTLNKKKPQSLNSKQLKNGIKPNIKRFSTKRKKATIQEKRQPYSFKEKLYVEGNMSFSMGEHRQIDFSPNLGYNINKHFSVGVGVAYRYNENKEQQTKATGYGGRFYTRYQFGKKLPYLQAEYEALNQQMETGARKWKHSALVGAGYTTQVGKSTNFNFTILRNLSYSEGEGPQNSPWVVRMGLSARIVPTGSQVEKDIKAGAKKEEEKKKFDLFGNDYTEGNVGFSVGEVSLVDFSPILGYKLDEYFSAGWGPSIQYAHDSKNNTDILVYGARVNARYKRGKHLPFGQVEFESLNAEVEKDKRVWTNSFLAGLGYSFPIGLKSSFDITLLRNLSWKGATPVRLEPWVARVGFRF